MWLGIALLLTGAVAAAEPSCAAPSGDEARDEKEARVLFEHALQLEPAQPEAALEALVCAERLAERPAIALRIGTIAERLGRSEMAADAFERYLERAGDLAPDVEQMRTRIARLRADARQRERGPAPQPTPDDGSAQRLAGWLSTGAGAALAIVGAVLLGVAKAHSDEVQGIAPGTTAWDTDEARGTYETAQREEVAGAIGLIAGGSVAVVGVVLLTAAPSTRGLPSGAVTAPRGFGGSFRVVF